MQKAWKHAETDKSDYISEDIIKNQAGEFSTMYNLVIFMGKLCSCINYVIMKFTKKN